MRNKYEFKIEEITSAFIQTTTDKYLYTTIFNRKDDNEFIITHSALVDSSKDGVVKVICPRCGRWNTFDEDEFYNGNTECDQCSDDYEEYCNENEFIEIILSFMDEDIFKEVIININEIHIK